MAPNGLPFYDAYLQLESVLAGPELLRTFVPFAHAQSGIRDELIAEALAVIDQMGPAYKEEVLAKAEYWGDPSSRRGPLVSPAQLAAGRGSARVGASLIAPRA